MNDTAVILGFTIVLGIGLVALFLLILYRLVKKK